MAASSSRLSTSTWARDSRAAFNSNDGFSVVAPTSVIVPSSTYGRKLSSWARLKRWISSTNRSVPCPCSRRSRACSKAFLRSATPENTADICTKVSPVAPASNRAMLVFPEPGGPHRTMELRRPEFSIRVRLPCGPTRWSWPTTSVSCRGRNRSAKGRGASFGSPAASNRLAIPSLENASSACVPSGSRRGSRSRSPVPGLLRAWRHCRPPRRSR